MSLAEVGASADDSGDGEGEASIRLRPLACAWFCALAVADGVALGDGDGVVLGDGNFVAVGDGDGVGVALGDGEGLGLCVLFAAGAADAEADADADADGDVDGVANALADAAGDGENVGLAYLSGCGCGCGRGVAKRRLPGETDGLFVAKMIGFSFRSGVAETEGLAEPAALGLASGEPLGLALAVAVAVAIVVVCALPVSGVQTTAKPSVAHASAAKAPVGRIEINAVPRK